MRQKTIRAIMAHLETQGLVKANLQTRECSISLVRGKLAVDCWLSAVDNEESDEHNEFRVPTDNGASLESTIQRFSAQREDTGTVLLDEEVHISSFDTGKDRGEPIPGTINERSASYATRDASDGACMTASAIRRDMAKFAAENPYLAKRYELDKIPPPHKQRRPKGKVNELFDKIGRWGNDADIPPLLLGTPCETHHGFSKTWMCAECGSRFCERCVRPRFGHFNPGIGMYNDKQAACPSCRQMCIDLVFEWRKGQLQAGTRGNKREIIRWSALIGLVVLFAVWTWQIPYLLLLIALFSFGPLRHQPRFARYITIAAMSWISLLSFSTGTIWPPSTIVHAANRMNIGVFVVVPAVINIILLLIERLIHAITNWITS